MQRRRTRPWGLTVTLATASIVAACEGGAVVDPRTAAVFEMVSGDDQTGEAGSTVALPLVVRLLDQTGQPIEGQEVVFTALGSTGATVTPVFALTGPNGTAETTLRLGSSTGSYDVTAKYRSFPLIPFSATAVAAPPATLVISSGNNQTATAGAPLPLPIRVRVTDAFGNPNAGVSVSFLVTVGGGGGLSAAAADTDVNGFASVIWTLGGSTGTQEAIAFLAGLTPVTFTATAQ